MVSTKERREIAFIIGAVLVVAIVGFGLQHFAADRSSAVAGAAISLDNSAPTYSGILYMLEEACVQIDANPSFSCDEICSAQGSICIPLEDNCGELSGNYPCQCCTDISE